MYQILTLNNIATAGIQEFSSKNYQIGSDLSKPDAILVRSFDMHQYQTPQSVLVIGRAGAGTNNIPIDQMTKLGIPVLNTPGANANAVKELVITGMLLASRHIFPAWDYVRQFDMNQKDYEHKIEKDKKQFSGFELPGKTLGLIGLGNIGVKVANAAIGLGMHVIGYDPTITVKNAWELSSAVQQADHLDEVLSKSDFISLHIPLNEHTRHFINNKRLELTKQGVTLLNFARDGIIDNDALLEAIKSGHVRSYVCDFPNPLFKDFPQIICLPHLGASTQEAEENCAVMVAHQVKEYLEQGHIRNSVNFPEVKMPYSDGYRLAIVNANVPNMVAQISTFLSKANINIIDMINKSRGEVAYTLIDVNLKITDDLLKNISSIPGVIRARRVIE